MQTWIRRTRKRAKCYYCEKFIETGEWQVVCRYFMKLKHGNKTWMKQMIFHAKDPYCWVERAIAELENRPVVETRGRKMMAIPDDKREMRLKLLRQRSSIVQRLGQEMEGKKRMERIEKLAIALDDLAVKIADYGGVPKNWETESVGCEAHTYTQAQEEISDEQ